MKDGDGLPRWVVAPFSSSSFVLPPLSRVIVRIGVALLALGASVAGLGALVARHRPRRAGGGLLIPGCIAAAIGPLIPFLLATIGLP